MSFEVRPAGPLENDPRASVLSDEDWRRMLALARRHGFDPRGEYEEVLYPDPSERGILALAATQELAVALSEALREETAPGGGGANGISVGPPDEPGLQVDWATVRSVGEAAESGSLTVTCLT